MHIIYNIVFIMYLDYFGNLTNNFATLTQNFSATLLFNRNVVPECRREAA